MDIQKLLVKKIDTRVRPPKYVTLIDMNEPDWEFISMKILRWQSLNWGGLNNIIVPTDGKEFDNIFWDILIKYNPDYFFTFNKSYSDIREINPLYFEDYYMKSCMEHFRNNNPEAQETELREQAEEYFFKFSTSPPELHLSISKELKEKIIAKCNPFRSDESILFDHFSSLSQHHHLNTSCKKILNEYENPTLVDFHNFKDENGLNLILRSIYGDASGLLENYKEKWIDSDWDDGNTLNFEFIDYESDDINENVKQIIYGINQSPICITNLTNYGLEGYYEKRVFKYNRIFVFGNSLKDFCLYLCLKNLFNNSVWIPDSIMKPENIKVISTINKIHGSNLSHEQRTVNSAISTSLSREKIRSRVEKLKKHLITDKRIKSINHIINNNEIKKLIAEQEKITFFDKENMNNLRTEQFLDNISISNLDTPKPKCFKFLNTSYSWYVDLDILTGSESREPKSGYILPPLPILSDYIFDEVNKVSYKGITAIRQTGYGTTFYCPNFGFVQSRIEDFLVRPRITLLDEGDLFKLIFNSISFNSENSDKGNYNEFVINLYGNLENLSIDLRNIGIKKILNAFISSEKFKSQEKRVEKKLKGILVGERIYLTYNEMYSLYKNKKEWRDKFEDYIMRSILFRGMLLKCVQCSNSDWYSISDINERFICKRCGFEQILKKVNWKKENEPQFYYKLNEVFYQAFQHNMTAPILTLDYLRSKAEKSFLFANELVLRNYSEGAKIEFDIVAVVDGNLILGESNTNSSKPTNIEKKNQICNNLNAQFLFSTTNSKLSDAVIQQINSFKWIKSPLFLKRKDLIKK